MKKLIFAFALMFGTMFMSCTQTAGNTEAVDTTDSIEAVVDSTAVDSVVVDSVELAVDSL